MVLPTRGLTRRRKGHFQGEIPLLGKERIRPTLMATPASATLPAHPVAKETPQPHAHPAVHGDERRTTTMLEVPKPAPQRPVHVGKNVRQTVAVRPFRFRPDR